MDNISDFTLEQSHNHLEKAKSAVTLTKQLLNANVVNATTISTNSLERYFFDQLLIHTHLAGIYIATPDGSFYYVSRNTEKITNGFRTKIITTREGKREVTLVWRDSNFKEIARKNTPEDLYDPRKRSWFTQAVKTGAIGWTEPYIFYTSKQPGVTVCGPSYWGDGSLKGVVGVDIDLKELSSFISRLRVGKTGRAFIFNDKQDVIASKDLYLHLIKEENGSLRLPKVNELNNPIINTAMKEVLTTSDNTNRSLLPDKPLFTPFKANENNYVAMFTPFSASGLNWIIGMYIPDNDYLGEIRKNMSDNLFATIVLSLLASFLAFRFANSIISPIKELQAEAKAIEQQEPKLDCHIDSIFSEIQDTADGFQRMKQSIVEYRQELQNQEKVYRTIIESASDAIILINQKGNISYLNPSAEQYFAQTNEMAKGKNIHKLLGISWHENIQEKLSLETEIVNRRGEQYVVEISLSPVDINQEIHTIAIVHDMSERRRSEELKKQLVQDLHDGIGGNLVNIKLLSQMPINKEDTNANDQLLARIAELCGNSILEIRSFMDLLDQKEVTWESIFAEIHQYCAQIAESHQLHFSKNLKIIHNPPLPSVLLALNLFKIIKEGITNTIRHAEASTIKLDLFVSQHILQCHLQDNGKGIPQDRRKGRGLISMKNRTEQLQGTFTIQTENKTHIFIEIPLQGNSIIN